MKGFKHRSDMFIITLELNLWGLCEVWTWSHRATCSTPASRAYLRSEVLKTENRLSFSLVNCKMQSNEIMNVKHCNIVNAH